MSDLMTELMLIPSYTRISIFWFVLLIIALFHLLSLLFKEEEYEESGEEVPPPLFTCSIGAAITVGMSLMIFLGSLIESPENVIKFPYHIFLGLLVLTHVCTAGRVWFQLRSHRVTKKT